MSYDKTVKDIQEYTGLDYHYILKCVRELPDVFTSEIIERGDNNSLLFNSNALILFDQIKQMKENNQSLKFMRSFFQNTFNQNHKTPIESKENQNQNELTKVLIEKLDSSNREVLNAFKETIKSKDEHIKTLESKILLITDGRSPEEVKKEFIDKEIELKLLQSKSIDLEEKLKLEKMLANENKIAVDLKEKELAEQKSKFSNLEIEVKNSKEQADKQSILVSEKETKLLDIENQKKLLEFELEEQKKKISEKESKKLELLNQLEGLEGKWWVGSQRKLLLKQLKELS